MTIASLNVVPPTALPSSSSSGSNDNGTPQNPQFWGSDGFTFKSFLDIINPLQQLPIVSNIYRSVTGDTISTGSRLAGGALMGPLGFASALFNEIVKSQTGNDVGGSVMAMIQGDSSVQVAQNTLTSDTPSPTNRAAYNAYLHTQSMFA